MPAFMVTHECVKSSCCVFIIKQKNNIKASLAQYVVYAGLTQSPRECFVFENFSEVSQRYFRSGKFEVTSLGAGHTIIAKLQ